jgi:hypothetical protein
MNQTVGHGTVCHALDAKAIGGSHAGDVGENGTADGDLTLFRLELDHENVLSFLLLYGGKDNFPGICVLLDFHYI